VRGRQVATVVMIGVLAGCGAAAPSTPSGSEPATASLAPAVPMIPRDALIGYVVRSQSLDAATVAADSIDPTTVETLLANAGFDTGAERRFTARWKPLTEVKAQVLRFDDPNGADTYLSWIRSHAGDLLGSAAETSRPPDLPGAVAFVHVPCSGCTKDPLEYLSAWTRGRYTLILLLGGSDAGRSAATPLAHDLDARVRREG
jgi:hypothetical protein